MTNLLPCGPTSLTSIAETDLSNEASVESFFVLRMLADLGYEES